MTEMSKRVYICYDVNLMKRVEAGRSPEAQDKITDFLIEATDLCETAEELVEKIMESRSCVIFPLVEDDNGLNVYKGTLTRLMQKIKRIK